MGSSRTSGKPYQLDTRQMRTCADISEQLDRNLRLVGELPTDGDELFNNIEQYLTRFVPYPSEDAKVAHTLWIVHTHCMNEWESTPRIAFLSPEPASGKTRAMEITETLVPHPDRKSVV